MDLRLLDAQLPELTVDQLKLAEITSQTIRKIREAPITKNASITIDGFSARLLAQHNAKGCRPVIELILNIDSSPWK